MIATEQEYRDALLLVESFMDNHNLNEHEMNEFTNRILDVTAYEKARHPIPPPTPEAAIEFRQEQCRHLVGWSEGDWRIGVEDCMIAYREDGIYPTERFSKFSYCPLCGVKF
jgi:hypothetical protein